VNSQDSRKWSGEVTRKSNALNLERGVFTFSEPRKIAESLKRPAERSDRRKGDAVSVCDEHVESYVNRAGRNLPEERKKILERARLSFENDSRPTEHPASRKRQERQIGRH
jgi:hypothetical protein